MRIIVTGSVAFDYLMSFPGHFHEHVVPEKIKVLSVSFLVDTLKKQYGGTATNIAYTLALLGERPELVATVGEDFADYRLRLDAVGVDLRGVEVVPGDFTSSCFINSDRDNNQITAFYPGAMSQAHTLSLGKLGLAAGDLVLIAPNAPEAMAAYAAECARLGIKYLYDPSMQAPRLSPEDLRAGFAGASMLIGNDYEFGMMAEKLGVDEPGLRRLVPTSIVTRGKDGATVYADGREIPIPAARPKAVVNPTGAGDSFRSGLIAGLSRGYPWEVSGRLGAVAAAYAIEHVGPQEHSFTREEFLGRYRENFGEIPAPAR